MKLILVGNIEPKDIEALNGAPAVLLVGDEAEVRRCGFLLYANVEIHAAKPVPVYGGGPQTPGTDPLGVTCPKCGAKPGENCNPHRDKANGKPIYRDPHHRRVKLARGPSEATSEDPKR